MGNALIAAGRQAATWLSSRLLNIRGLIVAFSLLGGVYSVSTPILEALDEVWHVAVIHHIVHYGALPVQPADPAQTGLWRQQGSQPPLYYLIGAGLTFWINTDDFASLVQYNPHASGGHPEVYGNKNILLHFPDAERFPWHGTALAVHLLRFYSLALGAATLYGIYRIARRLTPGREGLALLTTALVAFNPQFLFIHAGVINDTLAIALSTWTLERLTSLVAQEKPLALAQWRQWALVGLMAGGATLSKLSAGFLLPLIGAAALYLAWQGRAWREAVIQLALVGAVALLVSGWWFARNWQLYGDPTGLNRFIPVAGARPAGHFGLADFVGELQGLELSYWAVFGWFSILGDSVLYPFFQALDRLALLGLLVLAWRWARGKFIVDWVRGAQVGLLAGWFAILLVALYRWTTDVMGTQGRLMFPGAASVAVGLALGLGALLPRGWKARGLSGVAVTLGCIAIVAPFRYIAPAYRIPQPVADTSAIQEVLHLRYGNWGELVGYSVEDRILNAGDDLQLTLYWRGLQPAEADYDMYIHLRDADGASIGQVDSYPGSGMYQTSLWQAGSIVADRYRIPIEAAASEPVLARIEVGFGLRGMGSPVPAYDPEGRQVTPILGHFKVRGSVEQDSPTDAVAQFGGTANKAAIALASWSVDGGQVEAITAKKGERIEVQLEWAPLEQPAADYTVFLHLAGEDRRPLAQADGEPDGGRYPTSWWEPGERIRDVHTLLVPADMPPGTYQLLVGLYLPADGTRLAVVSNEKAAGDAYRLPITLAIQ